MLPVTDLKELNEQIIRNFYEQHQVESSRFDYKRELGDLRLDKPKKDLLKDVTAFANSQGGDLIVGVDENHGIVGIEETEVNGRILQIEAVIRDNADPPVPGIRVQFVPLANGKYFLVIRVPKSYIRPHRIWKEGADFYARGEAENFPLKMPLLRNRFQASEEMRSEVKRFSRTGLPVNPSQILTKLATKYIKIDNAKY